jgi:hypothetical protein
MPGFPPRGGGGGLMADGDLVDAFTNAFKTTEDTDPEDCQALGQAIEDFLAAPRTHNANADDDPTSAPTGAVLRSIGADTANAGYVIDAFGGIATFWGRRANGTGESPTAVLNTNVIARWNFAGYYTSGGPDYSSGSAQVRAVATEDHTSTAQGTKLVWSITANGSATLSDKWTLDQDGSLRGVGALGYATGAGGTQTQGTSKSTGVTLNALCGEITMHNASLNSATLVSFVLTNNKIASGDVIILNHVSGGSNIGKYHLNGRCGSGSATIDVIQYTGGGLSEAIVIRFMILKGVTA